jgi:hypothetical protein
MGKLMHRSRNIAGMAAAALLLMARAADPAPGPAAAAAPTIVPGQLIAQPGTRGSSQRNEMFEIACGPRAELLMPEVGLTVVGAKEDTQELFAPWHNLIISGGSNQGLKVGQEFYVRRVVQPMDRGDIKPGQLIGIHTAGWIRIVEVEPERAIAHTVHACDGFAPGDYLEPFTEPPAKGPTPIPGTPDFNTPGRVLFGDERRAMGAGSNLMVIDLGGDNGIKPGQQLTVFRRTQGGNGPIVSVARGTAVVVSTYSAMVRLEGSRDAVYAGDFVAVHR